MIVYQVDAFSDKVFGGNPAAVIPLESWPDDHLMKGDRVLISGQAVMYMKGEIKNLG